MNSGPQHDGHPRINLPENQNYEIGNVPFGQNHIRTTNPIHQQGPLHDPQSYRIKPASFKDTNDVQNSGHEGGGNLLQRPQDGSHFISSISNLPERTPQGTHNYITPHSTSGPGNSSIPSKNSIQGQNSGPGQVSDSRTYQQTHMARVSGQLNNSNRREYAHPTHQEQYSGISQMWDGSMNNAKISSASLNNQGMQSQHQEDYQNTPGQHPMPSISQMGDIAKKSGTFPQMEWSSTGGKTDSQDPNPKTPDSFRGNSD